ncbi:MAG: hypothetical protein KDE51_01340 [Anaerolineales bacterium]|nr:hypothetical protein [Anaerolineales bacterium]
MAQHTQYDPLDATLLLTRQKLSPGQRIQAMLDAREMLVGLMRGRLRRRYPHLSTKELNLKLLEEIDRVRQIRSRP